MNRIVSGGQTGVDRGALDAALAIGVAHGGWCPRGRRAEDGRVPLRYDLRETDSTRYDIRTEKNILDSDATLILHQGPLTAGTALTRRLAQLHGKPLRLIDLARPIDWNASRRWLLAAQVGVLNVAGPRESSCPGIADRAQAVLARLLCDNADAAVPNTDECEASGN
ncbi:MAG: putative molybdenum carrier protein [Planctomycetota bacterium]